MNIYEVTYIETKWKTRKLKPFSLFLVAESKPDAEKRANELFAKYTKYEMVDVYYKESVGNLKRGAILTGDYTFLT